MLSLSHCLFSTSGCWVTINGIRCDIESKICFLRCAAVFVSAASPEDAAAADDLMDNNIGGDDWQARGCSDPRLVELAIRYGDWLNDDKAAPWKDAAMQPLTGTEAMQAVGTWLAQQPGQDPPPHTPARGFCAGDLDMERWAEMRRTGHYIP